MASPPLPSPHAAAGCVATCEPALRDFLRKSTRTRRTVSDTRVALDRFSAMCTSGVSTPEQAGEMARAVNTHLGLLEAQVEQMCLEISGPRDTTVNHLLKRVSPTAILPVCVS